MAEQRNIVILGASSAGLQSSHYILKYILPALKAKNDAKYHVYNIAPSAHFYFKIASPRVAASTTRMAAEDIVFDLHENFKQYSSDDFTFIEASATGLDTSARTISYRSHKGSEDERLPYHALIVATGSRTIHQAFSSSSVIQDTLDSITSTNEKIQSAKSIIIVGGGPTAVEFAGEVGEHRNGKPGWLSKPERKVNITLITADKQLLPSLSPATAKKAEQKLKAVHVDVLYNSRVTNTSTAKEGHTVVTLGNGENLETDFYVPAYGVEPNSSWLPNELLDGKAKLITNKETSRVDTAGPRVYALGDITSYSRNNVWDILAAFPALVVNIQRDLLSYDALQPDAKPKGKDRIIQLDALVNMVVPIGKSDGVGEIKGWNFPSFLVSVLKGRDFLVNMSAKPMASGVKTKEVKWTAEESAI
ncbi:FAD/NAD(P)-binding domain-containing protein [Cucurbitaria berberidis CBS 394.84]|uniref:FAD/NAD(P)-binding domain-containing protein n=1 Tax=Cucurbitaria berberidis CBS 394.84 TaxID=1168544 RepID=A0A9P4GLU9_9PLEO|nr:FAD/NAD(P)-binding domain-containing protein [Cucurbitaria berberidis CBS 394.84]KAF1847451.1 FAD/NAD(P)-binding domain-containing protein [Cucurbitaria berberidis CBS 394.84]